MKVDLTCKDMMLATWNDNHIVLVYNDKKVIDLIFHSIMEAENFYNETCFLEKSSPRYQEFLIGVEVMNVVILPEGKI